MTTRTMTPRTTFSAPLDVTAGSFAHVGRAGLVLLRYGLVFLLLLWGAFKFTAFEAEAIEPLVRSHPLVSWLYELLGTRGGSAVFGVAEIGAGLGIAARRWLPRASGYASLVAACIFVVTTSFLFTLPGAFEPTNPWGGFLMKDLILLGAALVIAAEALAAARGAAS
jgi:uncharacterized membrane protein YkgB